MQHLDEGTIHAWLDDALPPDEAARVARHTAECAQCASLVAEARGLVAGASRVLSALDDVGAVVPGSWSRVEGSDLPREAARGHAAPGDAGATRRRFRRWPVAAAASVVLMVGTAVVWRETGGPSDRQAGALASRPAFQDQLDAPTGATTGAAVAPEVAPANTVPLEGGTASGGEATAPRTGFQPYKGSTDGSRTAVSSAQPSAPGAARTSGRGAAAPRGVVGRASSDSLVRAATDRPASGAARTAADAAAAPRMETRETVVPPAAPPAPAPTAAAANESPTAQRRFAPTSPTQLQEVVVTGVGTDSTGARQRRAAASTARAPAPAPVATPGTSFAAADTTLGQRTDSASVARRDSGLPRKPVYRAERGQRAASALEPNRPMAPRGVFALAGCYTVIEGRGLPKLLTLETRRFIHTGLDDPRYVAHADRSIGFWTPEGLTGVRIEIAGTAIAARIEPPNGELRGTVQRGAKKERFVARRGCS